MDVIDHTKLIQPKHNVLRIRQYAYETSQKDLAYALAHKIPVAHRRSLRVNCPKLKKVSG